MEDTARSGSENENSASDVDFHDVIQLLGPDDFQKLFQALDLKQQDIEKAAKSADSADTEVKASKVFQLWRRINGKAATRQAILAALERCGNILAKQQLEDAWNETASNESSPTANDQMEDDDSSGSSSDESTSTSSESESDDQTPSDSDQDDCIPGTSREPSSTVNIGGNQTNVSGNQTTIAGDQIRGNQTNIAGDQIQGRQTNIAGDQINIQKMNHRDVKLLVQEAVTALRERGGSGERAITRYIVTNYNTPSCDINAVQPRIDRAINSLMKRNQLVATASGMYRLGPAQNQQTRKKKSAKRRPKKKKSASTKQKGSKVKSGQKHDKQRKKAAKKSKTKKKKSSKKTSEKSTKAKKSTKQHHQKAAVPKKKPPKMAPPNMPKQAALKMRAAPKKKAPPMRPAPKKKNPPMRSASKKKATPKRKAPKKTASKRGGKRK